MDVRLTNAGCDPVPSQERISEDYDDVVLVAWVSVTAWAMLSWSAAGGASASRTAMELASLSWSAAGGASASRTAMELASAKEEPKAAEPHQLAVCFLPGSGPDWVQAMAQRESGD
jgi:hypothetical protein